MLSPKIKAQCWYLIRTGDMPRNRYIAHDQDRKDLQAEIKAERRSWRTAPEGASQKPDEKVEEPEYLSVEAFVTFMMEDDREFFTHEDLSALHENLGRPHRSLRRELESYGCKMARRSKATSVRGFTANPHNRWAGNPMCGGGGGNAIMGMSD